MIINYANGFDYSIVDISDDIIDFLKTKNIYDKNIYDKYLENIWSDHDKYPEPFRKINDFSQAFFFFNTLEGYEYWTRLYNEYNTFIIQNNDNKLRKWI